MLLAGGGGGEDGGGCSALKGAVVCARAFEHTFLRPAAAHHTINASHSKNKRKTTQQHDNTTKQPNNSVVPLHSHKLISELQHTLARCDPAASKQRNPLLIRVETKAGHGAGKPTAKVPAFVIFRGGGFRAC